jgi:hypothetical protein
MPVQRHTAAFSYARSSIYVSFTGNRVPFNVDTIRAIESLWLDIKTSDGEGSVAPKVRDVSYSPPLTYQQEKDGEVREAVARIEVPKGYEAKYFAAIRRAIAGFDITLLANFRKAQTQKATLSRGRTKRLPVGLGLRSSRLATGYDKVAAVRTFQSMLNAAARQGAQAKMRGDKDKIKSFNSFSRGGNGGRADFIKSLGEPYASQVKEAFYAAFDGAKGGSLKVADKPWGVVSVSAPGGKTLETVPVSGMVEQRQVSADLRSKYKYSKPGTMIYMVSQSGDRDETVAWALTEHGWEVSTRNGAAMHRLRNASHKVADFTMLDVITKMLKDFKTMQQAIGSMHSQVHANGEDLNHDLTAQVDSLNKKAIDFLATLEKFDTFLKTPASNPAKTSSLRTSGMGKAEYVRRLRSLKATLGHLMLDASVNGTAPKNLRKADASLEAEIAEVRGTNKPEEEVEETPATLANKK